MLQKLTTLFNPAKNKIMKDIADETAARAQRAIIRAERERSEERRAQSQLQEESQQRD
jgi:hypothetical protein